MIGEHLASTPEPQRPASDPLSEIERLLARARSGEIGESTALSRIARAAREGQGGEIYQKPWG